MTSIAQSLPHDIIHEIFKGFSTALILDMRKDIPKEDEFPWYLGQICSWWRIVFLSMHREFWSKYVLCPSRPNASTPGVSKRFITQTKNFLIHGQGHPFTLEIDAVIPPPALPILEILAAESTRWLDASLVLHDTTVHKLAPIKNRLENLRSLVLAVDSIWGAVATIPPVCEDIFENAPSLTHVALSHLSSWRFKWSSLKCLRLTTHLDHGNLLDALPHMENVEELWMHPLTIVAYDEAILVRLPHLKVLRVPQLTLLSIFVTPSLERLCIDALIDVPEWDSFGDICSAFFTRSSCQIRHLTLRRCKPDALAVILPHTPDLRYLEIFHDVYSRRGDCFNLLQCSLGQLSMTRQLETLKINLEDLSDEAATALITMIASRTTNRPLSVQPLQHLSFILWRNYFPYRTRDVPNVEEVKRQCEKCEVKFRIGND